MIKLLKIKSIILLVVLSLLSFCSCVTVKEETQGSLTELDLRGRDITYHVNLITLTITNDKNSSSRVFDSSEELKNYIYNFTEHLATTKFIWNADDEAMPAKNSLITLESYEDGYIYIGPYNPKAVIPEY